MIDWYPGHMKKARAQIVEVLPTTDLVIEVLDARLPQSSANPLLNKLRGDKPCLKILNKKDLADPALTREWVEFFDRQRGVRALPLDAKDRRDAGKLPKICRRLVPNRGGKGQRALRIMVVGIPNVGKSTLINTLAGKKMARVGDRPAITTCPQRVDLRNGLLLSDTPGLLWPVMDDQQGAHRLAASGAIGDSAFDPAEIALTTLDNLAEHYRERLLQTYKLLELPATAPEILQEIGRKRGCLIKGGEVDLNRAGETFLRELRAGKLGRISLERPVSTPTAEEEAS